jgi:hypothetical protein
VVKSTSYGPKSHCTSAPFFSLPEGGTHVRAENLGC